MEEYDVDLRAMIQTNMYGTPMASQNMERRGVGLDHMVYLEEFKAAFRVEEPRRRGSGAGGG